jgi:hypothetical protein
MVDIDHCRFERVSGKGGMHARAFVPSFARRRASTRAVFAPPW